jgi:hypothetical protein
MGGKVYTADYRRTRSFFDPVTGSWVFTLLADDEIEKNEAEWDADRMRWEADAPRRAYREALWQQERNERVARDSIRSIERGAVAHATERHHAAIAERLGMSAKHVPNFLRALRNQYLRYTARPNFTSIATPIEIDDPADRGVWHEFDLERGLE